MMKPRSRAPTAAESWLLRLLAARAGVPVPDACSVVGLEDGGMGSFRVWSDRDADEPAAPRQASQDVMLFDADGTAVLATLFLLDGRPDSVDIWRVDFAPVVALDVGDDVRFCPFCGDVLTTRGNRFLCVRGGMDFSQRLTDALRHIGPAAPHVDEATTRGWFCARCGQRHHGYSCPGCSSSLWSMRWDLIEIHLPGHAPRGVDPPRS